jgi:hypothetical protein
MANQAIIPYLTTLHYTEMDPVLIPQYISRFMDDWPFEETIKNYEQPVKYRQVWLQDDAIREQIKTNYTPVVYKLFRCDGSEVYSQNFDTKQQDADNPGTYIRQVDLDLATFDPGAYYAQINIGSGPLVFVSDPFVISATAPNTVLLEFSHYEKFGDIYFGSPFNPMFRAPAVLDYNDTASRDTIYEDDPANETLLQSIPYRIFDFKLGGARGVPPWLADKVKRIFCCQDVRIDGRYFTKQDGQKWDRSEQALYPMQAWTMQLREKLNRDSMIYENDAPIIGVAAAGLIVSPKGFGMGDNSGSDYIEISSLT